MTILYYILYVFIAIILFLIGYISATAFNDYKYFLSTNGPIIAAITPIIGIIICIKNIIDGHQILFSIFTIGFGFLILAICAFQFWLNSEKPKH